MVNFINKHRILSCIIFILILLLIPLLIDKIINSKISDIIPTKFTNEQWFSFWGSYIGSIVTILTLIITISYTQSIERQRIHEQRLRDQFEIEKRMANKAKKITILEKYQSKDDIYLSNVAFTLLQSDICSIFFETIEEELESFQDIGNKKYLYYKKINAMRLDYLSIYLDFRLLGGFKNPNNYEEAKNMQNILDKYIKQIGHLCNNNKIELEKLYYEYIEELKENLKKDIDKIYKIVNFKLK